MLNNINGDLNEANRDHIAYKKWEWKVVIAITTVGVISTIAALHFIYKPLLQG